MNELADKIWENFQTIEDKFDGLTNYPPYLAGGAVRDMVLGIPEQVKDLDFYISLKRPVSDFSITAVMKGLEMHNVLDTYTNLEGGNPIHSVWTNKERDVEYILLRNTHPMLYVDEFFDIGICEAVMDNEGDIEVTSRFMQDREDKLIKLRPKEKHSMHTVGKAIIDHLPRVVKKYPEYNSVIQPQITLTEGVGMPWYKP